MKLFKKSSWAFIVLIGVVSLFSDMTHEGARGITGPFLAALGASGAIVGFVAGFGELMGAGFADYPLIAFHFEKTSQVSTEMIPVMYAVAMGVDALAALLMGWLYDFPISGLIAFSLTIQLASVPFFIKLSYQKLK